MIYIFTGQIRSGKTSKLEEWAGKRRDAGGILMPVRSGKRYFFNISSGDQYPAESEKKETGVIRIGPYRFSEKGFNQANNEVLDSFGKFNILIIDEVGRIELNNRGFAPSLNVIINEENKLKEIDLILVVREGLVEQVINNFGINNFKIITDICDINL